MKHDKLNSNPKITQIYAVEKNSKKGYDIAAIIQNDTQNFDIVGSSYSEEDSRKKPGSYRSYSKSEYYCNDISLSGNYPLKVMPNGFYFYKGPNNNFYLANINSNLNRELFEKIAPDLCATVRENSHLLKLVCASEDRSKLYLYFFSKSLNPQSFHEQDGHYSDMFMLNSSTAILETESEINSVVNLPDARNEPQLVIALKDGTILTFNKEAQEIEKLSQLKLSDAELYVSQNNLLLVYSKNQKKLVVYNPVNEELMSCTCPQLTNPHLSRNYFTGLFKDKNNEHKLFILSLKTNKVAEKKVSQQITELLVINESIVCMVKDNELRFVENFLKKAPKSFPFFQDKSENSYSNQSIKIQDEEKNKVTRVHP